MRTEKPEIMMADTFIQATLHTSLFTDALILIHKLVCPLYGIVHGMIDQRIIHGDPHRNADLFPYILGFSRYFLFFSFKL